MIVSNSFEFSILFWLNLTPFEASAPENTSTVPLFVSQFISSIWQINE